jgi:hypothetical protein
MQEYNIIIYCMTCGTPNESDRSSLSSSKVFTGLGKLIGMYIEWGERLQTQTPSGTKNALQ